MEQSDRACLDVEVRAGQGHMAQSREGGRRGGGGGGGGATGHVSQ